MGRVKGSLSQRREDAKGEVVDGINKIIPIKERGWMGLAG